MCAKVADMTLNAGDRVRVIDPADRRKRVNGTVTADLTGKGRGWLVLLDDEIHPMEFSAREIVGRPTVGGR